MYNELIKVLNRIAEEFECSVTEGSEFAYYYADSLIVVNFADNDKNFLAFARKNGLDKRVSSFVISFFHELGHNETIDFIDEEYQGNKNALALEEYYSLEEEWSATEWAIDFCNNNMDIVEKIQQYL